MIGNFDPKISNHWKIHRSLRTVEATACAERTRACSRKAFDPPGMHHGSHAAAYHPAAQASLRNDFSDNGAQSARDVMHLKARQKIAIVAPMGEIVGRPCMTICNHARIMVRRERTTAKNQRSQPSRHGPTPPAPQSQTRFDNEHLHGQTSASATEKRHPSTATLGPMARE